VENWRIGEPLSDDVLGIVVTQDMLSSLEDGIEAQVFVLCDSNHNDIAELVRQGVRGVFEGPTGSRQILRALQRFTRKGLSH
jgi:hypothetical protein